MDLLAQFFPKIMGDAARAGLGAALGTVGAASCGRDRLIYRNNDVGDAKLARRPRQAIAAARTAHAGDQPAPPKLGEELFQI